MTTFDERKLKPAHIRRAIREYTEGKWKGFSNPKSAFLIVGRKRLPAKTILRIAYKAATGYLPRPEQLTGGPASVRVLESLGFKTLYQKQGRKGPKRLIKNIRREAFRKALAKKWGVVHKEYSFEDVVVPDFDKIRKKSVLLSRILKAAEKGRIKVQGKIGRQLRFDYYVPKAKLLIEFDERQHFTLPRAAALEAYPKGVKLGFEKKKWISTCRQIQAGDNYPAYRDQQRAYYDAIRDLSTKRLKMKPLVRIFEEDAFWEKGPKVDPRCIEVFKKIEVIVSGKKGPN